MQNEYMADIVLDGELYDEDPVEETQADLHTLSSLDMEELALLAYCGAV